ncbi:uncharacterized protein LOC142344376 [Convolutriloba macropyga]|uniref:uncharacterized protein LOC142344376 n=1 Tax=Convolutriloba macropyga TaxID=536237 RepID=UPI003F520263
MDREILYSRIHEHALKLSEVAFTFERPGQKVFALHAKKLWRGTIVAVRKGQIYCILIADLNLEVDKMYNLLVNSDSEQILDDKFWQKVPKELDRHEGQQQCNEAAEEMCPMSLFSYNQNRIYSKFETTDSSNNDQSIYSFKQQRQKDAALELSNRLGRWISLEALEKRALRHTLFEVSNRFSIEPEDMQIHLLNKVASSSKQNLILAALQNWPFNSNELVQTLMQFFKRNPDRIAGTMGAVYELSLRVLPDDLVTVLNADLNKLCRRNLQFRSIFGQTVNRRFLERFDAFCIKNS